MNKLFTDEWKPVKFGDVVKNVNVTEKKPLKNGLDRFVGLEHMDSDDLKIKRWGLIKDGTSFTKKFLRGQILFGKRRVYQHKAALADFDGLCSGDILVFDVKNDRLIPELLTFIVQSDKFFDYAIETSAGSLSPRTKWKFLSEYKFLLPPVEEQKRIAEILWAVEDSIGKLEKSMKKASNYKKNLSNYLFTYGLMNFSEINKRKLKQTAIGKLRQDYKLVKLEEICEKITVGIVIEPSSYYVETGILAFRSLNILEDEFNLNNLVYVSSVNNDTKLLKSKLKEKDVLIVRSGYPGTACVVPKEYDGANCIDLLIIRPKQTVVNSKYISNFFNSAKSSCQ